MKKLWTILLFMPAMLNAQPPTKTIFNPFTGRLDFINNLASVTAGDLVSLTTSFIQNRETLQGGATFYVSSATVLIFNSMDFFLDRSLFLNGSAGVAGQIATSGGVGNPTTWTTPSGGSGGGGAGVAYFNGAQTVAVATFTIAGAKVSSLSGFSTITVLFEGVISASHTGTNFWSSTQGLASFFSAWITSDNYSDFEFTYQRPLDQEDIFNDSRVLSCISTQCVNSDGNIVRIRPENVVGSYAVYHKSL